MRKILFVVSSLDVGGIETYLLKFLSYAGFAVEATVLCKSGRGGVLAEDYQSVGAKLVFLKVGTSLSPRYINLYRILRENKWDVICDFTGDFSGLVLLTARLAGVKARLAFYRGSQYQFRPTFLKLAFARFLSSLVRINSTKILSNSQVALDRFHPGWRSEKSRYEIIRNPAPTAPPLKKEMRKSLRGLIGVPEDAIVVAHVGRVTPAKNHELIVSVAQVILERNSNVWFVLIGLGCGEYSSARIPQHLIPRLKTFEHRSDIVLFLQASDVFLFPSLNEGMPNALIEAMAAGCSVVASDIPAIREVFPPSREAYLIAPNDVEGAVDRIERLIENPDKAYEADLMSWVQTQFAVEATFGRFLSELGEVNRDTGNFIL